MTQCISICLALGVSAEVHVSIYMYTSKNRQDTFCHPKHFDTLKPLKSDTSQIMTLSFTLERCYSIQLSCVHVPQSLHPHQVEKHAVRETELRLEGGGLAQDHLLKVAGLRDVHLAQQNDRPGGVLTSSPCPTCHLDILTCRRLEYILYKVNLVTN